MAARHLLRGDHEADRDRRQKALRNLREKGRGGILKDLRYAPFAGRGDIRHQRQYANAEGYPSDKVHEMLDLDLQRRPRLGSPDLHCDFAKQRLVARADDGTEQAALQDHCTAEGHVSGLDESHVGRRGLRRAWLSDGLASQRGILDEGPAGASENAQVSGHALAGLQEDDIPRNQVLSWHLNLHRRAVAAPVYEHRGRRLHALQRLHHALRCQLHPPLQRGRSDNHRGERQRSDEVVATQDKCQEQLASDANPEHDIEYTAEDLLKEQHPPALARWRGQPVLTEGFAPLDGLRLFQAPPSSSCGQGYAAQSGA
mmetsp:Transcript_45968/g.139370  ORF Transcript_45968/g.139370 Transcript_45968/m.139370 type:complete len:314 (-) Transcript_45968:269-1210(-)